ncbi:MAG TPA: phage holin family protein [Gemmatimonadales bacterium]|nr:phage holin family protein [Gemmatimonadales bacterium]
MTGACPAGTFPRMGRFLSRLFVGGLGLLAADALLEGIRFDGPGSLWIAALLLGLVTAVVRPVVVLITLPLTVLSLGFFLLIVNGAMLLLVARLMTGFHIAGLGSAIAAWIIVALTGWVANAFIGDRPTVEVKRIGN